jgi:nitrite reductase/ring-hydroxylating ferredoxin subunit
MADAERLICASGELVDSGPGVRFEVEYFGELASAFAIRYRGRAHAYLNRCAHVAMELDWQEGVFFDAEGRDIVCATHGAIYDPASGRCLGGPCQRGAALVKLTIEERDGMVYFQGFEDD